MGGVFMRKMIRLAAFALAIVFVLQFFGLLQDKKTLGDSLIRLHVVAASDSEEDQQVKLQVRDAVIAYVEDALGHVMTLQEAKAWLQENLPGIQDAANQVLRKLGLAATAQVSLQKETFGQREYDTFSLPSGVYESLRMTIGAGEGKNWWCVVFPSLCLPAAGESTEDIAAGAGFSEELTDTITKQEGYVLRFYFLDLLGRLENFFFSR